MKKVIVSLLCVISLMAAASNVALADESQYKKLNLSGSRKTYKALDLPNDSLNKFSRFTWSTNMVEWLVFAPNFGFEVDLKDPSLISCPSIFMSFAYRPGKEDFLKHENYSTNALSYWRARAEYRWHFRFNERREQRRGLGKAAMWINEKMFTKPIEIQVPDTAARNAGDEYAMRTIMSKEARIQEKIDSTMTSTIQHRTELFPGRYYMGIYGEYYNMMFRNDKIKLFSDNLKVGNIFSVGVSGGYDFPGFNYNHKCFMQWTVGGSLGLLWMNYDSYSKTSSKNNPAESGVNKVLPFITELKVALNFRNSTITKKYWQPDPSVYTKNIERNHEDSIHMAELDTILAENPVVIEVTSVNGIDSAFIENVDKLMIVNAFRRSTGLTYLLPTDFNMLEHTQVALDNKELSDNYFIEYMTTNRLRNYEDSVFISDRKNLPFKVQIAGRDDADSLRKSFVDSLKNYYATHDNSRPVFYGEPATKDSLKGFISKDSIAAQFSRIWGHKLDTAMIRTLYVRREEADETGSTTAYYDSVITEENINRRESYAMFIQFHPQVTLSGEDEGVGRFTVAMAGADRARELYNTTATFMNKLARAGMMLRVERPWNGKDDSFENRVTKEEVIQIMKNYGLEGVDESAISIPDSIYTYNNNDRRDTINFNFGVTENELNLPFIVNDSVGRAQAMALRSDTIMPWYQENYWDTRQGLYDDDPKVPGYHDTITGEWFVKPEKLIEAINDITFAHIKPYQIDSVLWRAPKNPMRTGQYAGKYRAQARMIFHREMRNSRGEMLWINIPYLIVPVETKEEAGFIEPKVEEALPVDSLFGVRDSVVYTLDSLGNIIDSTIIQIKDSLLSLNDSVAAAARLRNLSFADDSAAVDTVPEVKQLSVAEATALSKEAAANAKATAAEAKKALAASKKATANVKKVQKTADATIKKAQKAVNFPDSVVVTRDTVAYTLDSIGNVVDSTTTTIENKIANVLDSAQLAAVAERDSIIAAAQASVEEALKQADSLKLVADSAAVIAAEAKTAAAEAKKAIAEAKKAEKAAKVAAKQKAKEEAAAAKTAATSAVKEETVEVKAAVKESTDTAAATTQTAVESATTEVANQAAAVRTAITETEEAVVDESNKQMTVAEATEASKQAAAAAKQAAADAKAATAAVKKAQKDATAAQKAADAALKKVPATAEGEEMSPEAIEAQQVADSLQNIANVALQVADSLQTVANDATAKVSETKTAAAEAKKAIAEAKKAEKAAAAAAKQRAKEEAAAAKAAAKAAADAEKAEAAAAKEAAKEEASATTENVATEVQQAVESASEAVTSTVETVAENATTATEEVQMTEKERKAAEKAAAAEAKKKAKEEAAAKKAAAKAEAAAKKAAAAEAKKKAKEEAAAAKAAAKAEAEAAKAAAKESAESSKAEGEAVVENSEETTEAKE